MKTWLVVNPEAKPLQKPFDQTGLNLILYREVSIWTHWDQTLIETKGAIGQGSNPPKSPISLELSFFVNKV